MMWLCVALTLVVLLQAGALYWLLVPRAVVSAPPPVTPNPPAAPPIVQWPTPAEMPITIPAPAQVRLMDRHERRCHGEMAIDGRLRRPSLTWKGRKYQCARQEGETWIYRQVMS